SVATLSAPRWSGLKEELVGIVVERKQLGIPGPIDGSLELRGRALPELRLQALQEIRLGDAPVVVLLQGLVDPADRGMTQEAPRDDLLARRDARVREGLSERSEQDVAGVDLREAEELGGLHHGEQVVQLEVQPAADAVQVGPPALLGHLLHEPREAVDARARETLGEHRLPRSGTRRPRLGLRGAG